MAVRYFALAVGIIYLLVGIMGFIPALTSPTIGSLENTELTGAHGALLGLFPVNVFHNIVHLAVGILGIVSYRTFNAARLYSRGLAIFYGILAIMGLIPGLDTMFGLVPLFSHNVWLHAVTAIIAAYFGFAPQRMAADAPAVDASRRS
jgi:hypothetical protein